MGKNKSKNNKAKKMTQYEKDLKRHLDFIQKLRNAGITEDMANYDRLYMFEPIGSFAKTDVVEVREEDLPTLEEVNKCIETPEEYKARLLKQSVKRIELIEDDETPSVISL